MSRAKRGFKARRRKNKIFKAAKGFHFDRRTKYRTTADTVKRAMHYAYVSRRLLKRDMRALWIQRISAGAQELGTSYSKLMGKLGQSEVALNRKMLSEIAATDAQGFKALYQSLS